MCCHPYNFFLFRLLHFIAFELDCTGVASTDIIVTVRGQGESAGLKN